jgi:tetratricopeptide (TPR) repeat protein
MKAPGYLHCNQRIFGPKLVHCLIICATLLLSGCVATEMAGNFANNARGDYYLASDDPKAGEEYFYREVTDDPDNVLNNYYYGRLLLRSGKAKAALPYLQKAGSIEPDNGDYQFWIGVASGSLKQVKEERRHYEMAVKLNPEHVQALTALGHSYMRAKRYTDALKVYGKALALWPENPAALYNRALALSKLGKRNEEMKAWHRYLGVNSSGTLAQNAVDHLNELGDFSYRNYILGARKLTVKALRFEKSGAELAGESLQTLELIGDTAAAMRSGVLQVVVYQKGDVQLAKSRALNIRRQLLKQSPDLDRERIGISWFGESQRNRNKKWNIEESVDFFLINK